MQLYMTNLRAAALLISCLVLWDIAPSLAQTPNASVYVVHAVPGSDVGIEPSAAVDVAINGRCGLTHITFRQIVGPITLPGGTHIVTIHPANVARPCGLAPLIGPTTVPLHAGETTTIVAYLGTDGRPAATKHANNFSRTASDKARVAVHHTANAPEMSLVLTRDLHDPLAAGLLIGRLPHGEQAVGPIHAGSWFLTMTVAGTTVPLFGPVEVNLQAGRLYSLYVVGTAWRSLDVIVQDVAVR